MATVWKAQDELLGRVVALKVLDDRLASSEKARRRFLHDAQTAAALHHPAIIGVHDVGQADGVVYIALAFIDGETLADRVARSLLPIPEATRVVRAVADALSYAHEHRVVHRDVTSRNIMIARDGRVHLLDFGLALAAWETRLTSSETAMGTAPYMAPELLQGRDADVRSDLYSVGVVFYEALTGARPFEGGQNASVFYAALNLDPVPLRSRRPDVPAHVEQIVGRLLSKVPESRHSSARELIADLDAIAAGSGPGTSTGAGPPFSTPATAARRSAGGLPAMGRPGPLYLALLPFEVLCPGTDDEEACAAIARRLPDVLAAALAGVSGLNAIPVSDRGTERDPIDLARQAGANAYLRGSVGRAGGTVRISYAVVDAWNGTQFAGDVLDGSVFLPFDLEDQVVTSLCRTLDLPDLRSRPTRIPRDPAAPERFRQALAHLRRYDNEASIDGAIRLLEQLVAADEEDATYPATLARAYLQKYVLTHQRSWEAKAASACARARQLDPESIDAHLASGDLLRSAGQYDPALQEYDEALRRRPGDIDALLGRALVLGTIGRTEDAEGTCRQAIELHPEDWRGHSLMGWVHYVCGDHARALDAWRRVVVLTPDNARGRRNLGSALYRLNRFEDAAAAYRESLAIQPSDEAYTNLGTVLYFMGRRMEAIEAFRKATDLAPANARWWGNLGNACRWVHGHEAKASEALNRAIDLMRERLERNPHDAEGWAHMAGWLANRGDMAAAGAAIRRALDLAPHNAECLARAGHVHFQLGDRASSMQCLEEALRHGYGVDELRHSVELAPLREDPEFARLISGTWSDVRRDVSVGNASTNPMSRGGRS